ncbi:MAG: aminotransferase class I/II-fold pyridoxal phosphate-dependent enzyme, partial [Proteobacteria bacterium]|nr:aminotransferase class I/II-fold pyridoxal phosphate-dependent enzyme [Pseudomonadota bacterium]
MNPLAIELNEQIQQYSPNTFAVLSSLGKEMFFPKGILSQSAEAKEKAHKFNATIGIALENGEPMHLAVTKKYFNHLTPAEIYPYAPPAGRPKLRELWKAKMLTDNPQLKGKTISEPVVTNALTHGLSLIADLFVDRDDVIISPDKLWGNYRLTFTTAKGAKIVDFPLFNELQGFNTKGFAEVLEIEAAKKGKLIIMLNFPNNPTGYTPTVQESIQIHEIIKAQAEKGTHIITVSDDAYFGLFFEDSIKESLFGGLCELHENVLAIKLDGATKEDYAWGFRTGFITFGTVSSNQESLYRALETKVKGNIRGTISNCPHVSQSVIEKIIVDPDFNMNHREKYEIMKGRANRLKEVLKDSRFDEVWSYYPFNSGYFMCLKLKGIDAEKMR